MSEGGSGRVRARREGLAMQLLEQAMLPMDA